MRRLSFESFLATYVKELSFSNTLNLNKLTKEVLFDNPRLKEPLFLYVLTSGKTTLFMQYISDTALSDEFNNLLNKDTLQLVIERNSELPIEYTKVYKSYVCIRDRSKAENHTKELMLNKFRRLKNEKRISDYKIYTDLKINPGNFNAFVKREQFDKLSLDKFREVLNFIERT